MLCIRKMLYEGDFRGIVGGNVNAAISMLSSKHKPNTNLIYCLQGPCLDPANLELLYGLNLLVGPLVESLS